MKAIILDTETNGKIKNFGLELTQENLNRDRAGTMANFPNIAQIAWEVVELETGEVLKQFQSFIKPDGWTIPTVEELQEQIRIKRLKGDKYVKDEEAFFFVNNNMSTERCEAEGRPADEVYDILVEDLNDCVIIVCHNASFDVPTLKADLIRYKKKVKSKLVEVCTMKSSTQLCKLPKEKGYGYKWPKLEELYRFLFSEEMEDAHDAFADTTACRKCFVRLVELNVILLKI